MRVGVDRFPDGSGTSVMVYRDQEISAGCNITDSVCVQCVFSAFSFIISILFLYLNTLYY